MVDQNSVIAALAKEMPAVMRWGGEVAKQLRKYNIALHDKASGFSNTDALTLADLTVQELLVAALRDGDPIFKQCRIEAEESTGDLRLFDQDSPLVIALDPIDGTKQYRDRSGDGWSVMLHLRTVTDVVYSLVYIPAAGESGRWVEATPDAIRVGNDDLTRPARAALDLLPASQKTAKAGSKKFYMIGFAGREKASVEAVSATGLTGVDADETPGCIYDLMATGEFAGSLIHSPNIYDYPVAMHLARQLGGNSVWVKTGEPVHFRDTWMDERAKMLRLPGIVATAVDPEHLKTLCEVARDWNPDRYAGKN